MTNSYVAKVRAKRKAEMRRALQLTLWVGVMIVAGAIGVYLGTVFYVHHGDD